jgi:hypothetical protein
MLPPAFATFQFKDKNMNQLGMTCIEKNKYQFTFLEIERLRIWCTFAGFRWRSGKCKNAIAKSRVGVDRSVGVILKIIW